MANYVYIATSIDGYIADKDNGLDWLETVPNPTNDDLGFNDFIATVDAMVMGRKTYETVLSFGIDWPYTLPVFVYSRSLKNIPEELQYKVQRIEGAPEEIIRSLTDQGYGNLYIDGGKTVQSFLEADLIDELIITKIPVLLGGGVPLFGALPDHREFHLISSEVQLGELVTSRYRKKK